jgi:short-subunit dehydrogenase
MASEVRVLILVARREERLQALKEDLLRLHSTLQVEVSPCDLTDPTAIDTMLQDLQERIGSIDILVNNAGLGDVSRFHTTSLEKLDWMLRVNVNALTHLSHRLIQPMVARGRGGVLNISSSFAFTFMPGFGAYAASKMYVTGLTEALRLELRGTGVSITQICPGPVATEFEAVAGNPLGKSVPSWIEMSPERCARISVRAFRRGRALVIPGVLMKVVMGLTRITPRPVLRFVYRLVARTFRKAEEENSKA